MQIPVGSIIAVYFVAWWICLFVTLPFGARSQHDAGEIVRGSEPGAPAILRLWPKLIATSVLAAIVTAVLIWGIQNEWLREYLR